jgi:hypothetical protein
MSEITPEQLIAAGAAPAAADPQAILDDAVTPGAAPQPPAPEPPAAQPPAGEAEKPAGPRVADGQPQWLQEAFDQLHERLSAVEKHLGL